MGCHATPVLTMHTHQLVPSTAPYASDAGINSNHRGATITPRHNLLVSCIQGYHMNLDQHLCRSQLLGVASCQYSKQGPRGSCLQTTACSAVCSINMGVILDVANQGRLEQEPRQRQIYASPTSCPHSCFFMFGLPVCIVNVQPALHLEPIQHQIEKHLLS